MLQKSTVEQFAISEGKTLNGQAYLVSSFIAKVLNLQLTILIRQLYVPEYDNPVGCLLISLLRSHYKEPFAFQCHICHLCRICEVCGAKAGGARCAREHDPTVYLHTGSPHLPATPPELPH